MTEQTEGTDDFNTDAIDVGLDLTTTEGVKVPMQVKVTYPAGYGFYAVKGLQSLMDSDQLWNEMIQRQDASTIRVMLAAKEDHQEGNGE